MVLKRSTTPTVLKVLQGDRAQRRVDVRHVEHVAAVNRWDERRVHQRSTVEV